MSSSDPDIGEILAELLGERHPDPLVVKHHVDNVRSVVDDLEAVNAAEPELDLSATIARLKNVFAGLDEALAEFDADDLGAN